MRGEEFYGNKMVNSMAKLDSVLDSGCNGDMETSEQNILLGFLLFYWTNFTHLPVHVDFLDEVAFLSLTHNEDESDRKEVFPSELQGCSL